MVTVKRKRIEIIAFERQRIVRVAMPMLCPVCRATSEMLTTRQASAFAQVKAQSIRRWLSRGLAHGVRTPGGQHRVCKESLFSVAAPEREQLLFGSGD
jgi:hypothetical protein